MDYMSTVLYYKFFPLSGNIVFHYFLNNEIACIKKILGIVWFSKLRKSGER